MYSAASILCASASSRWLTELGTAQYRLAIPRRLLPGGQKEGLAKLKGLPIGMLSGDGELNRRLKQVFNDSGSKVEVVAESDTFANLRDLVQTGAAAASFPSGQPKHFRRRLPPSRHCLNSRFLSGHW